MTRKDMAPPAAMKEWSDYYIKAARAASCKGQPRVPVVFVDARQGVDIHRLKMIALKAGAAVNQRCVPTYVGGGGWRKGGGRADSYMNNRWTITESKDAPIKRNTHA